jgi:hypothetical protein
MRFKFACALLFLLALSATLNASALTISGGLFKADVAPGEQIKHKITVSIGENDTATEAIAGVFGYGFSLDGARGILKAEKDKSPYSARGFLSISPESALIKPGEPVTFVLEGKVPEDVGSGGRYALVHITTPPSGSGQVGIALAAMVPVLLTISGSDLVETGEITNLTVSGDNVSAIFKNNGNHHFKASAEAVMKNDKGEVVASAEAPLMSTSLVPTASWLFKMNFKQEKELAPGTYTVEANVTKEDGTVLDLKEKSFTV